MSGGLRRRLARWLDPQLAAVPAAIPAPPSEPPPATWQSRDAWPAVCERFAFQILGHAETLRPALDRLEADEHDEERLRLLYQVDHSVTRMRRAARDLRILSGVESGDVDGHTSSLVDVVRAAESAIEQYSKVDIGRVVDLAVVPYASDDLASLLAALLDNATRYSPSMVKVSAHLLDSGGVMLRVEDNGIGMPRTHLEILNAALAGPVPQIDERAGTHTGFPVVHRLARKHGVDVRFAARSQGRANGTIAMVLIPPDLLCEIPDDEPALGTRAEPAAPATAGTSSHLSVARPSPFAEAARSAVSAGQVGTISSLPQRTRTSLRGATGPQTRAKDRDSVSGISAGARSFAEDLNAFTAGQRDDDNRPEGEER